MSNPRAWRGRGRTETPNSRQKRNKLFLDAHRKCACGAPATEAHHELPHGHPDRQEWAHIKPKCSSCHVKLHQQQRAQAAI